MLSENQKQAIKDGVIETPDLTIARYVYTNPYSDPVFYDGIVYWVVMKNGMIEFYE
jgi:hypothetical protein